MQANLNSFATVLLFVVIFATIGWIAPAMFASYVPADYYVTVHDFEAENASAGAESHNICFNRTVKSAHTSDVLIEMYLISDDSRTEVQALSRRSYFQKGSAVVKIPMDLPEDLEPGAYRYGIVSHAELANGRVTRRFSWTSESFYIGDQYNTSDKNSC